MIVFGLILLLIALVVIAYVWLATRGMDPVQITYGVLNVEITPIWLFAVGGIALAAATCGIWLLAVGTRSKARKAKEVRTLRRNAKDSDRTSGSGAGATPGTSTAGGTTSSSNTSTGRGTQGTETPILPRTGGGAPGTGGTSTTDRASGTRPAGTDDRSSLDLDR